ncbi:MAG TPA: hypothetical protein VFB33_00635 [Candidatus Binataceae bacterium]|nr:hypothetical protein [Candidatus Binataceae bacterium]
MARKRKQAKPPPLSDAQRAALAGIRRRRRWFWGWAVSYLPVGYVLMRGKWQAAFAGFVVVWTAALAFSVIRLRAARCPRCGAPFHAKRSERGWTLGMTLGRRCLSCGLELGAGRTATRA